MRALNLFLLLLSIVASFSLNCQQDRSTCDLKTVYKTLRTPEFNQAWANYKRTGANNPYYKLVDDLYTQNSSVATYVKNITNNMRTSIMSPAEKQLFDKHQQLQKEEIDFLIKINNNQPSTISASTNLEHLSTDIINIAQRLKFPFSLNINLHDTNTSFGDCTLTNNPFLLVLNKGIDANINLYLKDLDSLQAHPYWRLPVKKESQNKLILGCLLHELAHMHYLHSIEDQMIFTRLSRKHIQEYEADWYWARKNKNYASLLENLSHKQNIVLNIPSCESHPATKDRYKNLKEIHRLKEAESRWIWGPKGYEKYGDPAYEKAFINWSEKQK